MNALARQLEDLKARHPVPGAPSGPVRDETAEEGHIAEYVPPAPSRPARAPKMGIVAGGRPAKRATTGAAYVNQANAVRYRRLAWLIGHVVVMTEGEKTIAMYLTHLGGFGWRGSLTQLGGPVGMAKSKTHYALKGLCRIGFLEEERTRAGKLRGYRFLVK